MQIIPTFQEMKKYRCQLNGTVAVVPTMGALHDGHLSLVKLAKTYADTVIMTIFVNPTQFGPKEDFSKYPRDLEGDLQKGASVGVDCFFTPQVSDMYPDGFGTYVAPESPFINRLEGVSRPGHFKGVATIVCKLFNIVQPQYALFGLKDFQQCLVIKKMVEDLNLPVQIVEAPIYREPEGLAMSSRNQYLTPHQRQLALGLSRSIQKAKSLILEQGETNLVNVLKELHPILLTGPEVQIDYAVFVDPHTLEEQSEFKGSTLYVLAVKVGATRLLDNALIQKP